MARGNTIMGKMHGKVGDVVTYVANGEQVIRARNRDIKNPQTQAQMTQRAIIASVMQMYGAGKMIFDHSFEGKRKGRESMRYFYKLNVSKLKAALSADVLAQSAFVGGARFVEKGRSFPSPFEYIVSTGSLANNIYLTQVNNTGVRVSIAEDLLDYEPNQVFRSDDIFTILVLTIGWFGDNHIGESPLTVFGYIRLSVSAFPQKPLWHCMLSEVFSIETYNCKINPERHFYEQFKIADISDDIGESGAMAVIRSRKNTDLRSNAEFVVTKSRGWGLTYDTLENSWWNKSVEQNI